ncbi:unnamed protein product [Fusarium fujikuroi]|nr:unnamed protein product [Fusarium fujikuroi]
MSSDSGEKKGSLNTFFRECEPGQAQQKSIETGQHVDQQAKPEGPNPALAKVLPDLNTVSIPVASLASSIMMLWWKRSLIRGMWRDKGRILLRENTMPVLRALLKNRNLISEAEAAIQSMRKEGPVPQEVLMVTIEALARTRASEAAMHLFNDMHLLTGKSPRLSDIGLLLRHASQTTTQYDLAVAYNSELAKIDTTSMSIGNEKTKNDQGNDDATVPETWMDQVEAGPAFDVIIPACAQMGDFDLAFKFIDYAKNAAPDYPAWRSASWVEPFIKLALDAEHPGVWKIVDLLDQGQDAPAMMVRKELQRRRIQKRASS